MKLSSRALLLGSLVAACFLFAYHEVILRLVRDWATDDNYSHGFLIVPIALFFAWERRHRLEAATRRPNWFGLVVLLGGLALLVAGTLGAELFLTRISLLCVLAGIVLVFWGWDYLRILAFPLGFLVLMIPIPAILFNQIAFPLQLLASRFGETALSAAGIPVFRDGNIIVLANTELEVAEACSGIRSLVSLLTLGIVFGYLADKRISVRVALALASIPIAILANGFRVAGTGIAAHYYGAAAAEGFFHTFSGWLLFGMAFVLLIAFQRALILFMPPARLPHPAAQTVTQTSL